MINGQVKQGAFGIRLAGHQGQTTCPATRHPGQVSRFVMGLTNRGVRAGIQNNLYLFTIFSLVLCGSVALTSGNSSSVALHSGGLAIHAR